ncbi:MAG: phosphodiester glycosidase family protein [Humibacter sp.]
MHSLHRPARAARLRALIAPIAATAVFGIAVGLAGAPAPAHADGVTPWLPTTPANWSTVVQRTTGAPITVTSGVTEHSDVLDTVTGREPGQVLNVDMTDPNVRVGVQGMTTLINPKDETISSMAARTGAVAGINGGFFDINASGQPDQGQIVDGEIWKSPQHNHAGTFVVLDDGTAAIRDEEFSGTITDGSATHALYSVNWTSDATSGQITEITPRLGGPTDVSASKPVYVSGTSTDGGKTITVASVGAITSLPAPSANQYGLLAAGTAGGWLTGNIHVGDTVTLGSSIAPDNDIRQLLQGPGQPLVAKGAITSDYATGNPTGLNPETAIGVSADGKHLTMVTLDGRGLENQAVGMTVGQVAGYMVDQKVSSALLLDGGGSSELIARKPGDTTTSVMNAPSDGGERPVGNGIFVYSTQTNAGKPSTITVNGGQAADAVVGMTTALPAFALDSNSNPVPGTSLEAKVTPAKLGTWANGAFTAAAAGTGHIRITAPDGATTNVKLTVAPAFASLAITPSEPNLAGKQSAAFQLTGTTPDGGELAVPIAQATWKLSTDTLGTFDATTGTFTASADGSGKVDVTATAGGASATADIAVGSSSQVVDPLSDIASWSHVDKADGVHTTVSNVADVPSGATSTTSISDVYTMPGTSGVHQMVFSPKTSLSVGANASGQLPTALGIWIKDNDTVHNTLQFAVNYTDATGHSSTLYNTGIVFDGQWHLLQTQLPAGTAFPIKLGFIDFLTINPTQASAGTLEMSSLEGLYAERQPVTAPYVADPQNPSWLQFVESPADFSNDGNTILMGDDAHLLANDPKSTSAQVLGDITARVSGDGYTTAGGQKVAPLPAQAKPDTIQSLGDSSDDGLLPDVQFAKNEFSAIQPGAPVHDLAGNHEITQGSNPENTTFNQVWGDTHYSYTDGAATVIALDNSHGGITSSDPFQVPALTGGQYPWLASQLDAATSKIVIVAVHMPADDPFPAKNSQFTDRWEAQQYLQLVQNFQKAHPQQHVIMVYGHARGYSEQILDPAGNPTTADNGGIPQFVFGDLGMPAYTAANQGGFYHFGLVHVAADGRIQVAVEPVLQSLAVDQAATTLAVGKSTTLTATGVNQNGDNGLAIVNVPIADPVSHVWSSSNPHVASVDAVTGKVTALRAGTTTITVETGGMTATQTVTVG